MTAVAGIDPWLAALATWNQPGAVVPPGPGTEVGAVDLVNRAVAARLAGPLVEAAERGAVVLPAIALDRLHARHGEAQRWCLHLETRLLEVHDRFALEGGVEHLVVKGPAVAHLDEPAPELRSFADIDLLVAAHHLDRSVAILTAMGASRSWPELRSGYDRRFAKSVTLTFADGVEIDLHRTLADGVFGQRIPLARLFARRVPLPLAGVELAALDPVHRTLHAAYHAVLGSPAPRMMSLRDLVGYLSRPGLGPEVVADEAARWGGIAVLAVAVDHVVQDLGVHLPAWRAWSDTVVEEADRRLVARQRAEGSGLGVGRLAMLRELPRADRPAFALALAWPTAAHLRARGLTRWSRLRR